ncbi:hypothetical protein HU200_014990 [Digitaria exilis]|uniref:Uncharacterized protein n=1 Tax=Digitaria exilis TaxID=1010633 RepID=A0A835FAS3_9POAL|nr:hypothetical protein HU200_014990 [Digitaria exilis]
MAPSFSDYTVAFQAAVDGNLRLLKSKREMANKVDLRAVKDNKGCHVLHAAAAKGHFGVCKFLVEEMAFDVNSTSDEGECTVIFKIMLHVGKLGIARLLLSKGVPLDPLDHRGTPLHLAALKDQDQTMKILLEHAADPNRVVHHIFSPLVMACSAKSLKCMKLLVQAGADVNFKGSSGPSAIMYAVDDGFTDIVKYLLEVGADPNIPDHVSMVQVFLYLILTFGCERRELVEILFPRTRPLPSLPDWSIDGIIQTMKYMPFRATVHILTDFLLPFQHNLYWSLLKIVPCLLILTAVVHCADEISVEDDITNTKAKAKELFAKGEYLSAIYFYDMAAEMNPLDATLFANQSLCWLRMGEGNRALTDAVKCRMMRPQWAKAWEAMEAMRSTARSAEQNT